MITPGVRTSPPTPVLVSAAFGAALRGCANGAGRLPAAALLATVAITACTPKAEKADGYEALHDRLMTVGAFPAALKAIQKAIEYDPDTAQRWLKLARVRDRLSQPAAAATAYQRARDLQPDSVEALQNLSVLAVRAREYDLARRYIEPLLLLSPNDRTGLLTKGATAIAQRRFDEASSAAESLIETGPDLSDGYILKARLLDATGKSRDAAQLMAERSELDPGNKDILTQLLTLYRKMGDRNGIRATAIRLMPLLPDDPRFAMEAARAYKANGDSERVREIIDQLKTRFAKNPAVMVAVADFWRNSLPADAASAQIAEAAKAASLPVKVALARSLVGMGQAATAIEVLQPIIGSEITARTVEAHALFARALLTAGRTADADMRVAEVLAFDEGQPEALIVNARRLLQQRRFREAANIVQRVISDDETNEEAALLLANVYVTQGNDLLAVGAFGSARQNFPDSLALLRAEIDWLRREGRVEEAAQRATSYLTRNRGNVVAKRLRADLCRGSTSPTCQG
jgi:tetratricopeptide (TPR) repeat protein